MAKRSIEESTLIGIADAIREKNGTEDAILTEDMADKIREIETATDPVLQEKSVSPTATAQTISADSGYDGLSVVTIAGDANLVAENIKSGISIFGVDGAMVASAIDGTKQSGVTATMIVTNPSTYGFDLTSDGYYTSNNAGVANSYALCKVNLTVNVTCNLIFDIINYAETGCDYGIFGKLDSELTDSDYATSYQHSSSSSIQTLVYFNVEPGSHYIYVKYTKDSSVDTYNDSLKFKLRSETYERFDFADTTEQALTNAGAIVTLGVPAIAVDSTGLVTASLYSREGAVEDGELTGTYQLLTNSGGAYTPSKYSYRVVPRGNYLTGDVYINGDANLVAENIASGVSIFGVTGTYTGTSSETTGVSTVSVSIDSGSLITGLSVTFASAGLVYSRYEEVNDYSYSASIVAKGTNIAIGVNSSTSITERNGNASYKGSIATYNGHMEFWQVNGDCNFEIYDG